MWTVAPVIFEDESEEALKSEFIRLAALYPAQDVFEIASYVFRNQRDPELRSQQAGMIWSKDLEVKERIRLAKLNDGKEPEIWTKEKLQMRILAVTEDENIDYRAKKSMLEGYALFAKTKGWILDSIKQEVESTTRRALPQYIIAQYAD